MKDPRYSARVLALYRDPRGAGRLPPGDDVGTGEAGEAGEGDLVRIQVRVDSGGRIDEARFNAFGCPATIACASFAADWVAGRPADESLSSEAIADALDLGPEHLRQADLAADALGAAVADWARKRY